VDQQRAGELIDWLGERLGDRLLLWRGPELGGSDVDVLALPGAHAALLEALRERGLAPSGTMWTTADDAVRIHVFRAEEWPRSYQPLHGIVARAERPAGRALVAAPEDRLLMYASELVGGRPLSKLCPKARRLLAADSAGRRLDALAAALDERTLARLIANPDALMARGRRGRLPYTVAARAAASSRMARAALAARVVARLRAKIRPRRRTGGTLVALSGMDGAGKSTVSTAVGERLRSAGLEVAVAWNRLGEDPRRLNAIAAPVKRLLRRSATISDPTVSRAADDVEHRQDPRVAAGRIGPVEWIWILIVTTLTVTDFRRTARSRRRGGVVICDRWACDAIVDLKLRYGDHRAATLLLRHAIPRPDVGVLLEIDAATAAERKPADLLPGARARMQELYAGYADTLGLERVAADRDREQVIADVITLVEGALPAS
jgi:thymidylate kinase